MINEITPKVKKRKIFNPDGDDTQKRLIGAPTTNLIQLNRIKYKDIYTINTVMLDNFWRPEKIDITMDKECYNNVLTSDEKEVYEIILSFLIFLDSIQTCNISANFSGYFTASEVVTAFATQAFFEEIHSQSYQYILNTIFDSDERKDKAYNKFKNYKPLYERTLYIGHWYQDFQDKQTPESFFKALCANYILEAIYFYNSFIFFYTLSSRNLMIGTEKVIKKINIDENLHVALYEKIIKHYIKEEKIENGYPILIEMIKEAVEKEIIFMSTTINNKILGITPQTIGQYTKYLANLRLSVFNIGPIYENVKNPYPHLKDMSGEGVSVNKDNFFETTIVDYNMASAIPGWDEL